MNIEVIESKDADTLARLNKSVHDMHVKFYPKYYKKYDYESIRGSISKMLNELNYKAYIDYCGNKAVGYVLIFLRNYKENPFCFPYKSVFIDQISVEEEYQNRKIGTLLMDKVNEFAAREEAVSVELMFWDKMSHAKKFYEKLGFEYKHHFVTKSVE